MLMIRPTMGSAIGAPSAIVLALSRLPELRIASPRA